MAALLGVLLCLIVGSSASQILSAYYSGLGAATVGQGGLNTLSLCFFDPKAMADPSASCNFNDMATPCVAPATGGGTNNLQWAYGSIQSTFSLLKANTAPVRGQAPTYFISFGGANEGGQAWDTIFAQQQTAVALGQNAAALATTLAANLNHTAVIGIDLDIEDTTTSLPYFGSFISAFRARAPYSEVPLQICSLSALANASNPDNFKMHILKAYGPAQGGISHLNMMVNNHDQSCDQMAHYWRDPGLDFIPPQNRVFGVWGELFPSWILHDPGCGDLFPWMRQNGVGVGIWEWWSGPVDTIAAVVAQVRQGS